MLFVDGLSAFPVVAQYQHPRSACPLVFRWHLFSSGFEPFPFPPFAQQFYVFFGTLIKLQMMRPNTFQSWNQWGCALLTAMLVECENFHPPLFFLAANSRPLMIIWNSPASPRPCISCVGAAPVRRCNVPSFGDSGVRPISCRQEKVIRITSAFSFRLSLTIPKRSPVSFSVFILHSFDRGLYNLGSESAATGENEHITSAISFFWSCRSQAFVDFISSFHSAFVGHFSQPLHFLSSKIVLRFFFQCKLLLFQLFVFFSVSH